MNLQDKISSFLNSVKRPAVDYFNKAQQGVQQSVQNTANNVGYQFWHSPIGTELVNTQNAIESSQPIRPIPQVNVFKGNSLPSYIGNSLVNIPGQVVNTIAGQGILDPVADIVNMTGRTVSNRLPPSYNELRSPQVRFGYNIQGIQSTPKEFIGNIAGTLNPIVSAYNPTSVANAGKEIVFDTGKRLAVDTIKEGIKEGAKLGFIQGGINGLDYGRTQRSLQDQLIEGWTQAAGGALAGGLIGGVTNATSLAANKAVQAVRNGIKILKPSLSDTQVETVTQQFIRDELGRFAKQGKIKDEPLFYSDLRESIGLPRNGNYQSGAIDFNAKVGKSKQLPTLKNSFGKEIEEGLYHGSPKKGLSELKAGNGNLGEGVYLTKDVKAAKYYAAGWAGGVDPEDFANVTDEQIYKAAVGSGKVFKSDRIELSPEEITNIKNKGFIGIQTPDETVIFDPKNVKITGTLKKDITTPNYTPITLKDGQVVKLNPKENIKQLMGSSTIPNESVIEQRGRLLAGQLKREDPFIRGLEKDQLNFNNTVPGGGGGKKPPSGDIPQFTHADAEQVAGRAQEMADTNYKKFQGIFAKFIGKRDVARTTGVQTGSAFKEIPADLGPDIIKNIENPGSSTNTRTVEYTQRLRDTFDNLYKQAKDAGLDIGYLNNYITHIWDIPQEEVQAVYKAAKQ